MGKHERDWVDIAEESVSAAINGKSTNKYINEIALSNIKHIEKKFNTTVISSKWTGSNNYACPGDVEVFTTEHPTIPVELKFSKENGSGTKANPSTNMKLIIKLIHTIGARDTFASARARTLTHAVDNSRARPLLDPLCSISYEERLYIYIYIYIYI